MPDRYLLGQDKALSVVAVPPKNKTEDQENSTDPLSSSDYGRPGPREARASLRVLKASNPWPMVAR